METQKLNLSESLADVENSLQNSSWTSDYINNIYNVPKRVFELLYDTKDIEGAIQSILGLLGEANKVSRVYIFEDSPDHQSCSNTFEWCAMGISPEIENLTEIAYEDDLENSYLDNFDDDGIFFCPDTSVLSKHQYEIIKPQGIVAMLQSAIMENGEFKGFIGFDDCTKSVQWTEEQKQCLLIISKIIGTFLCKMRREEALVESNGKLQKSLDQIQADHRRLIENEQRFRLIMQTTSVSMWEYDIKNKAIIQTDSSQRDHGFDKIVKNVPESLIECGFVHPDSADSLRKMYDRLFKGEKYAEGTFRVRKADRNDWWYEKIMYSAVPDEQGNPSRAIAISNDVTSEITDGEKMRQIVDNVLGGIGIFEIIDNKVSIRYLNNSYYALLGDTRDRRKNYAGCNFWKAIYPDDVPIVKSSVKDIKNGKSSVDFRYRVINVNGHYTWLRLSGNRAVGPQGNILIYCNFINIDAYMNALFELQKSQTLANLAMQNTNMTAWEFDVQNHRVILTDEAQKQHGLEKYINNLPQSLIDNGYVHPDSASDYRLLFSGEFPDKKTLQYDVQVKTPDGKDYWWERHFLAPVYDQNCELITAYGTSIDVTEQKKVLEYYQKQANDLEKLSRKGIITKARYNLSHNKVEYFHREMVDTIFFDSTGSYDSDLANTKILFEDKTESEEFLKLFDRQMLIQEFESGHKEVSFEYRRKTIDGAISWCLTQGTLHLDPITKDIILFMYSQDITDQKITQKMIDEVVRLDYDFMSLLDLRTKKSIAYANMDKSDFVSGVKLLQVGDFAEKVYSFANKYLDAEDNARCIGDMSLNNIKKQLEGHERFTCSVNIHESEGKIRRKMFQFSYLDRVSEKVLITCTDITDIYQQEQEKIEELKKAKAAAENAQAEAEEANRTKSRFFANMSHDLRTPLNAVIGLTELAKDEITNPNAISHYISSINSSGKFLLSIVNDGLDLEKISSGCMTLCPKPYTFQKFQNTICAIVEPLCAAKNISFLFKATTPRYTVCIDSVRLKQLFINLLSNAVKFTPNGGKVEFLIHNDHYENSVLHCDFIVRDNGIGMSKAFQKKMFEPFSQESNQIVSQLQGTGLGLSIVKKLVELMGGWIKVKSEQGKGTEFTVHLDMPVVKCANSHSDSIQDGLLRNKHILLVEDHPLNMQIAKKLLEKKGMFVACAQNGKVGVRLFKDSAISEFDVILMDVRMPIMDGLHAAKQIRSLARADAASIPIIAMSANSFDEDIKKSLKAGMNEHLSKPINPEVLYTTIQKYLKKKEDKSITKRRKKI